TLLGYRIPALVRVELGHRFCCFRSILAQVLLVQSSVLIGNESCDPGIAVLFRIGHKGEASRHLSVRYVIFRSAFCIGALFGQDAVEVAVKWLLLAGLGIKSFGGGRIGCQRTERALRLSLRRLPVQSVLLAFAAYKLLRVLLYA